MNELWSTIIAEVFHRLGLKQAVISPGSRSTPLTYAFSQHHSIECIPVLDERSGAFFALGLAKQSHQPVVLISTSGTAVANYFPAIIEARESKVSLIALTADRPPEMRHCQSGQTIDQQKIFGTYPKHYAELCLPSSRIDRLKYLRQTLVHAWDASLFPQQGPVHLNIPFRDPLTPSLNNNNKDFDLKTFISRVTPPPKTERSIHTTERNLLIKNMLGTAKGLIVAGVSHPENPQTYAQALGSLAKTLGWPTLAEGLSPLRNHSKENPYLITRYDVILRNPTVAQQLVPDMVLSIGPLPTSKVLRKWLDQHSIKTWILEESVDNVDALHRDATVLHLSIETLASMFKPFKNKEPGQFCQNWNKAEAQIERELNAVLETCPFMFEGKVAWLLSKHLPDNTPLFIANSMPVRDVEFFWQKNHKKIQPLFNRGANGIDGILSTAFGIAYKNQSSVLLTGDLAFLHDVNALLIKPNFKGHLTIILINNHGGGIFEFLPISAPAFEREIFEKYFAMPQSVCFRQLASAHDIEYKKIGSLDDLQKMLNPLPSCGIRLLEIKTNRKKDMDWRKTTFANVASNINLNV
jgi:2-succinyl-5-enolpyruvyl-6-hydroxy-3-cyclohexene-1-carboxylate synthase